jgi:hypothetical protein
MSIENPFGNLPPEGKVDEHKAGQDKKKHSSKIGNWARKTAALAGAVGVGYFGSMQEGVSSNQTKLEGDVGPKLEQKENKSGVRIETTDSFDVLHRDEEFTWGVEYVPRQNKDKGYLAERYVKINNETGKSTVLGEYDNIFDAAKGISKMTGIPEEVRQHAERDASIARTEKNFQASGFTEPTVSPEGKTHMEERTFEGYNIKAKNKVEVDEKGNVVRIADSESSSSGE